MSGAIIIAISSFAAGAAAAAALFMSAHSRSWSWFLVALTVCNLAFVIVHVGRAAN